ncbi:hypothetical protein GSY74_03785 [Sulfurovum sp. bin170]|uniref:hypothetical protein n=1 Tax=Sulfurovum sp. bin170 TaxID=2695268 RepID=UPI0013E01939|nr:hypothetical protein [Sulfurovum sp. bin170]NEW60393.1 hypothetical protein [Sulfurovum sp. bin170]
MKLEGEPSLEQIDDYDNNESPQKRRTVRLVVLGLIIMGIAYAFIEYSYSTPSDYVGTPENPGIDTSKR